MEQIDESLVAPDTPREVKIRMDPVPPSTDPRVGVEVAVDRKGTPRHRLVAIGDSLTHGFQSGAIYNTDISYPAIIAWELGWLDYFRYPRYPGVGGLPLNIEFLARGLQQRFGHEVRLWELAGAALYVRQFMDEVEDWWERGPGSIPPKEVGINHNLGIFGWDLRDALEWTADNLKEKMKAPTDQLFRQTVQYANELAGIYVLESARDEKKAALTPVTAAAELGEAGTDEDPQGPGIETLIVMLGANNALSTVTQLRVRWSGRGYDDVKVKHRYNVWRPSHFKAELEELAEQVDRIRARHVIWGTVPHVTIAPIARGVGTKVRPGSRYFPYYTRPWIDDRDFDVDRDPYITEQQARAIDSAIDQYNESIATVVKAARREGKDWYLLETCGLLDRLASRRYIEDPTARPKWWSRYELPPELKALDPVPDSRFFGAGPDGRIQGGLFSLDGVHPTTIGYGILAQEIIDIMQLAGVSFLRRDGVSSRHGPVKVDFARLIKLDTLISDPPEGVTPSLELIGSFDERLDIFRRLLRPWS